MIKCDQVLNKSNWDIIDEFCLKNLENEQPIHNTYKDNALVDSLLQNILYI